MKRIRETIKLLGPGLLFAGAAVGVSHLVQSTRAGASFGFELLWVVILANLLKFPFFEFGPRYTMATGESLLHGYKRLGYPVLVLFLGVTLLTVFTIQSAVTIVTAGIAQHLMPISGGVVMWSGIILVACLFILAVGSYKLLDKLIKFIIILLSISTLIAVVSALGLDNKTPDFQAISFDWSNAMNIAFLIGLMGWMPAPIDLSVWHSIWSLEKRKVEGNFDIKKSLLDFNIGYIGTAILAILFLSLGSLVMFGSGIEFSSSGSGFANQLINLYTESLGQEARWIIAIAAFTTMFSTTITCFDAIPRVLAKTTLLMKSDRVEEKSEKGLYWIYIFILLIGAVMVISYFSKSMLNLVQLATILSFITAPFYAIANFTLVKGKHMPMEYKPGTILSSLSYIGIIFLLTFTFFYIYTLIV